jgi:hypothetical protein
LYKSSVREFLESTVNPSEAERLFYDIKVGKYADRIPGTTHDDPALLG